MASMNWLDLGLSLSPHEEQSHSQPAADQNPDVSGECECLDLTSAPSLSLRPRSSQDWKMKGSCSSQNLDNHGRHSANNNSFITLSMIQIWLRNQPAPPPPPDNGGASGSAPSLLNASAGGSGRQKTSIYLGVSRQRTGRYEARLWDKERRVCLGAHDNEENAARAHDLAALKYWGPTTRTNFPITNYQKELQEMQHVTRQECIASLRRESSGFSRGASIYRGIRRLQSGRWQARMGRVAGTKNLSLGTFNKFLLSACTEEEAAEAYDKAVISLCGPTIVTNFPRSRYEP